MKELILIAIGLASVGILISIRRPRLAKAPVRK